MLKKAGLVLVVAAIVFGGSSILVQHNKQGNTADFVPPSGNSTVVADFVPPGGNTVELSV